MLFLAIQNLVFDVGEIVVLHILFQDLTDVRELIFVDQLNPVGTSNTVSFALRVSLVAEDSSLVEGAVECSHYSALGVSDDILLLLVDLVSDITFSSFDEDDLVDLI